MAMRTIPHRLLWPLDRGLRGAVRGIAFTGKELHEVLRQARLLLALVAGPFLILLLFGTSYRGEVVQQPTVLVLPTSTGLSTNVNDYVDAFQFPFTFAGIVRTPDEARALVKAGRASVIAVLPDDAWQRIQSGQHPLVTVTFDKVEPVRANYLTYYAYVEVNELNRRVLISIMDQARTQNPQATGPAAAGLCAADADGREPIQQPGAAAGRDGRHEYARTDGNAHDTEPVGPQDTRAVVRRCASSTSTHQPSARDDFHSGQPR